MSCLVSCDLIFITRPVDTRGAGVKLRGGVGGKDEDSDKGSSGAER